MMTPKEALLKDGTIPVKEGRGRLSREAVERCKYLVANEGYSIKGYEAQGAKPSTSTAPAQPVEVKRVAVTNVKEVKDFTILWPEESFKAIDSAGKVLPGKWGGMREVCNLCRVSLVQNQCEHPTVHNGIAVKIVPK